MPTLFNLEVHTPYRLFFSGKVELISLTLVDGEIGVYAKHSPFTAITQSCVLRLKDDQGLLRPAFIADGILEVKDHNTVLMVDSAEWPEEIDPASVRADKEKAEEKLKLTSSKAEIDKTKAALHRAELRLKALDLAGNAATGNSTT